MKHSTALKVNSTINNLGKKVANACLTYKKINSVLKKQLFSLVFFIGIFGQLFSQQKVSCSFAAQKTRDSVAAELRNQIEATILLPFNKVSYQKYAGAFWAMELMLYRPDGYPKKIPEQILQLPFLSPDFQRSFLEMLFTLYQGQFVKEITDVWPKLATDKVKAMALEYLAAKNIFPLIFEVDSFYKTAYGKIYYEKWKQKKNVLPSKRALLDTTFLPGETVLCSFQSTNRNFPGYLMIRNESGKWVADDKGKPLKFAQLARSMSNLPYYITNGNTPQGLYKITGMDFSVNNWIGPTTNLQMIMPFENGSSDFFGNDTAYIEHYKNLLGPLAKYHDLMESFVAGRLGRSEIIAHGTTIDPAFYKKQPFYPNTPSLGCLCSPEIWDKNGTRIFSAQMEWINAIKKLGQQPVYLIVAEVNHL